VDLSKCTSCGECAKVCPIEVTNEYDEGLSKRRAAFKKYPQAIPGGYAITKLGTAPCRATCPAHVSIQGYIALINAGKYREALELFKQDHPFPGVCGRVCTHPCETACTRQKVDEPLGIMNLHRFIADQDQAGGRPYLPLKKDPRPEKVAIIGAGPAGLTCAYFLAIEGYQVTVFEKLPVLGGMLTIGIPSYRLPRNIIEAEIQTIRDLGVEFRTGVEIGKDFTIGQLRQQGYKAFFLGIGSQTCKSLGIEGEELAGVYPGLDFLKEVNLGNRVNLGDRVAVIGGGNVAMDAVRTALRTGSAHPFIVYRRSLEEMPANEEEIEECRSEGIEIMTLVNPMRVISENGRVKAIECLRMALGAPDQSGRRRPEPIPGSEFIMEVDAVIPAIGQESDWACLTDECACALTAWGTMKVDPVTLQTDDPDIFAGGDAVSGPRTVVEAIGAGKEAAVSIDRLLQGLDLYAGRPKQWEGLIDVSTEGVASQARIKMSHAAAEERVRNFNEVQLGYPESDSLTEARRCLKCGVCSECYQCVEACLAKAVTHDQTASEKEIEIGSVVLTTGSRPYDPSPLESLYQYRSNPNVLTSLEFERILSASGPTQGHLARPSDGKEPKKIAWLQCIGSRDTDHCGNGYCSAVCCMYAIKDAMIAKDHAKGELDCAIFNMDIRTFGKDYEKYYLRAKDKSGVRFIKARVHSLDEIDAEGDIHIRYTDESGQVNEESFDLMVLSVGLQIPESSKVLAQRLGVQTDGYGFARTATFAPVETSRQGVYACGVFQSPKDIPSSVVEASAAACLAGGTLAQARNTCTKTLELPEEIDVSSAEPRIGVFVCNCGINIAGTVDVAAAEAYARSLPHVVFARQNLFSCSQDSLETMKEIIQEHQLNRVVVAACTPKTHEGIFMDTLQSCGLNKYLLEMANIRNQDSWVHSGEPLEATDKARELIRMAVSRAGTLHPLSEKVITVNQRAVVIGGGVAGMNAALGLADQGYEVVLIEKEDRLGGMANRLTVTIEGDDVQAYLQGLIERVTAHPLIQVLTRSLVVGFTGFQGNFTTEVLVGPGMYERKINHGVTLIATGAIEYQPKEYLYGQSERVMTQVDLTRRLKEGGAKDLNQVAMIQCVGSRDEENPNCSRICCQNAIKNAIKIKNLNPEAEVYLFYRDIRTYGLMESYYKEAREKGVVFFRFDPEEPPQAELSENGIVLNFRDRILDRDMQLQVDLLALSAGMVASDTEELASIVKLARTAEGYFMEAHVKLRPVDMATEGIFVCGTAHSPKLLSESIAQAQAAASRATTFLSRKELTLSAVTARVEADLCAACLICVRSCPYAVPKVNADGFSEIDEALCHGCGICAAECPAKAIELNWYEDDQLLCKIDTLMEAAL
jgi:heterodisulfide reductase subunit A-like polyferredoxin